MEQIKSSQQPVKKSSSKLLWFVGVPLLVIGAAVCFFSFGLRYGFVKTQEEATKANLAKLRTVVGFYKEGRGTYPTTFEAVASDSLLLKEVPKVVLSPKSHFRTSREVRHFSSLTSDDGGTWGYVNEPSSPDFGKVFVNCTHQDINGREWYSN